MFKAVLDDKNICAVIHRRAGKDIFCLEAWVLRGLRRIGTHVYLFPLYAQARSVIWNGMDFHGRPFLTAIPEALVLHKNQARMEITLFNGSRLILAGSNNYDSLMGTNPVTIIYSEFALHNPLARQYLNPILLQNKGLEIINSTPRGMNHLWEFYNTVKDNDRYHVEHLSIDQTHKHDGTPIFTQDDLKEAKSMGMSEEMIRQELYCDFEVGNLGAYYTREMSDMEREGRIMLLKPDPRLKLHSVWDLGGTDATAGLLFQITGRYIHLLYLLHNTGKGLKFYLDEAEKVRQSFQCEWGNHFMPHDVKQQHQGWEHTESRIMQARKAGWHLQVVPLVNVEDGIEAVRYMLPKVRVDKINCALWARAMREYQRQFNETKQRFDPKPLDNWAIHIADATRYLGVQYKRLYDIPQAPMTYNTSL
jgi:hypothetical protein